MSLHHKRKDIKLMQEKAWDEKNKLDKMSPRDKKYSETQARMIEKAQKCGYAYRRYLKGEGRDIKWDGMDKRP